MTKDELKALVYHGADGLTDEQVDSLTNMLYPSFEKVEFHGKTVCIRVKTEGNPPDTLNRMYAYADWLKHFGAKNVMFMPLESEISAIELTPEKVVVVRFFDSMPEDDKLVQYKDWFRIAGADPEKVMFLDRSTSVETR